MSATDDETESTNWVVELEQQLARTNEKLVSNSSELQASSEYQAATARILEIIRRYPTNGTAVLQAISETAAQLFDAPFCHVFRFDGSHLHFTSSHGLAADDAPSSRA